MEAEAGKKGEDTREGQKDGEEGIGKGQREGLEGRDTVKKKRGMSEWNRVCGMLKGNIRKKKGRIEDVRKEKQRSKLGRKVVEERKGS